MDLVVLGQLLEEAPGLINDGDAYGATVLMRAARSESVETVEWMLDHGASVDQVNRLGDTALFWACQREGRQDVIALLLNRGADPCVTSKDGRTALMLSAGKGQVGSVGQLLKWRGPQGQRLDANATDRKGRTALWEACANGHGEVARLLLTEGLADPCVAHVDGRTPLAAAQAAQHTDAITLLQEWERSYLVHKLQCLASYHSLCHTFATHNLPPPSAALARRPSPASLPAVCVVGEGECSQVLQAVVGGALPEELLLELLGYVGLTTGASLHHSGKRSYCCVRLCGMVVTGQRPDHD